MVAWFPEKVQLNNWEFADAWMLCIPPPSGALFPEKMQLVSVGAPL